MREEISPVILWFRRDLRLSDHAALSAACDSGRPVVPVFILDDLAEGLGAAPKWRLGLSLEALRADLAAMGSRLILRRGPAREVLQRLIGETGADTVLWSRLYDPDAQMRDRDVKSALKGQGIAARSYPGHVLFEPWTVETKTGGYYRVYSPMWRAVKDRDVSAPVPRPERIAAPAGWPPSDRLADWALGAGMRRGAEIVGAHVRSGEAAALARLDRFLSEGMELYKARRDFPGVAGTSGLAEYLSLGEISPRRCWHAALWAREAGMTGAETFLKELAWREFAYHLMYHSPHILTGNWRPEWDRFPWSTDPDHPHVRAWQQGRTGMPFVDAAMREMYVTGRMHNRGRMIVASYLTKHLMTDWRIGLKWFEDHLIDWDPASNALGWQWTAGSGPDAAPYFRVFNPETQLEKFDRDGAYRRAWIAEGQGTPAETARDYFRAIPKSWGLSADTAYPAPVVSAEAGRRAALAAYENRGFAAVENT